MVDTAAANHYWSQPAGDVLAALHSTPAGLTTDDAVHRLQEVGPNVLKAREQATPLRLFLAQFKSPIVLILQVIRTQRPFFRSVPSRGMVLSVLGIGAVTLILPFLPLEGILGFTPLPVPILLALVGIAALYVTASEVAK